MASLFSAILFGNIVNLQQSFGVLSKSSGCYCILIADTNYSADVALDVTAVIYGTVLCSGLIHGGVWTVNGRQFTEPLWKRIQC